MGIAANIALAIALVRELAAPPGPAGRTLGGAQFTLRRSYLFLAALLFIAAGIALWQPIPLRLSPTARLAATLLGAAIALGGPALYLWGWRPWGG